MAVVPARLRATGRHLAALAIVGVLLRAIPRLVGVPLGALRVVLAIGIARRLDAPFAHVVDRAALEVQNLPQTFANVIHDAAEIELLEAFASLLPELLQKLSQSTHPLTVLIGHATLQQAANCVAQVAVVHQVVGQARKHFARIEIRNLLSAIPLGIAKAAREEAHRARYLVFPLTRSLLRSLLRCIPSRMNSAAEARSAGLCVSASRETAASRPSICLMTST